MESPLTPALSFNIQYKALFSAFLYLLYIQTTKAQILNPSDRLISYSSSTPPISPSTGIIGKWVYTPTLTGWNDSSFKAYIYNGMPFRLQYPTSYKPGVNDGKTYPLIIMFHGAGEGGTLYNNDLQLAHGGLPTQTAKLNGTLDAFCLFPQNTDGVWNSNYYQFLQDISVYMEANCKVDPQRIVAHGLSAGGQAIWSILNTQPKWLAAAIPMSAANYYYNQGLSGYEFTPIWLAQGGLDRSPDPSTAQKLVDQINAVGGNLTYSFFPTDGHDTWDDMYNQPNFWPFLLNANKANPFVLFGRSNFCSSSGFKVNIGITPGFDGYQWKHNDTLISGEVSNSILATSLGTYSVRYRNGNVWSTWSPKPVILSLKSATITPSIQLSRLESSLYPSPDTLGGGISLTVPGNFIHYSWVKAGTTTILDTNRVFIAKAAGSYQVTVAEQYGCSGNYSPIYTILSAVGTGAPASASNLSGYSPSLTSIKLSWVKNKSQAYPNTGFEVYRANQLGGPYSFLALTPSDTTQYLDKNLVSNKTYYYEVRAVNGSGASALTPEIAVLTQVDNKPPTAPGNLIVIPGTATTQLIWGNSTDNVKVSGYTIYVNGVKSFTTSQSNYTLYGLSKGATYFFTVAAFDDSGNISSPSNQVSAVILDNGFNYVYYESPGNLSVVPNFNTLTPTRYGTSANISLSPAKVANNFAFLWNGTLHIPVTGSYTFQTSSDDGSNVYIDQLYGPYVTPTIANDGLHATTTGQVTLNLTKGDHSLAVTYFQGSGGLNMGLTWSNTPTGIGSNPVPIPDSIFSTPIKLGGSLPKVPGNFMADGSSYNKIFLSWVDSLGSNLSGVEIYRSNSVMGPFSILYTAKASDSLYIDSNSLSPGTLYYYQIRSINNFGSSKFTLVSAGKTTLLPTPPPTPFGVTGLALSTSKIKLSWKDSLNSVSGYNILRSVGDTLHFIQLNQSLIPNASGNIGNLENLALNKPAFASSSYSAFLYTPGSDANLSFDGNFSTRWCSNYSDNQWIYVDLGQTYNLSLVKIFWQSGLAKNFQILLSNDAVNWSVAATISGNTSYNNTISMVGSARYVRMQGILRASGQGYSINEFQVFGLASIQNSNLASITLTDSTLIGGTDYYYRILSQNAGGNSPLSSMVKISTMAYPPPIFTPIAAQSMRFGTVLNLNLLAKDPTGAKISLELVKTPNFVSLTDYSDGTGLLTLNPNIVQDTGKFTILLKASSIFGASYDTLKVLVNQAFKPIINPVPTFTISAGDSTTKILTAQDINLGASLTWTFSSLPSFVNTLTDAFGKVSLIFKPLPSDTGTYTIGVVVMDGVGGMSSTSIAITVNSPSFTYLNFGDASHFASKPWNNTGWNLNSGTVFKLNNQIGTSSGTLTLLKSWSGTNNNGVNTGNNSGIYPDLVTQSSFSYTGSDTIAVQLGNLDPTLMYDLSFFSSWYNPWSGSVTSYGVGSSLVSLDAKNNSNKSVSLWGLIPDGNGNILIKVAKGVNSANALLGALVYKAHSNPNLTRSAPNAPLNLASRDSLSGVGLSWINSSTNATGIQIYRTGLADSTYSLLTASYLNPTATSYIDASAKGNAQYYYKIKAFNAFGNSSFSNIIKVATGNKPPLINPISNSTFNINSQDTLILSASALSGTSISLSLSGLFGSASFKDLGSGKGVLIFSPLAADTGKHFLTLTARDSFGGISTYAFTITITGTTYTSTFINFGDFAYAAPKPWNNTGYNVSAGSKFNLYDQNSVLSGTMTLLSNFGAPASGVSTGNNSGVFPDFVMSSSFSYSNSDTAKIQISGLNPSNLYDFTFFTSWSHPWSGAVTNFAIGTTLMTLDGTNNSSKTVSIKGVTPNASGIILIKVSRDIYNASSALINALVFQSYTNPNVVKSAPNAPINLVAKDSLPGVILNWASPASNASGYGVYRAPVLSGIIGNYVPLNLGVNLPNQNSFLDTTAKGMESYSYRVNAYNAAGISGYATTNTLATAEKTPLITNIGDINYNIGTHDTLRVSAALRSGSGINLSMTGLFGSAVFTDLGNGMGYLSLSPVLMDTGNHTLVLTAKDNYGGISTKTFKVIISGTVYTSTYINFGTNSLNAPSPWNNTGYNVSNGNSLILKDQMGLVSGKMTLLSNFGAPSSGVNTGNNTGIYPDAVISSSFSYSNSDTAKIQISGLNPTNLYDFTLFSSWSHPWSGAITYFGIGSNWVSLDAGNNSSKTVTLKGMVPNSSGIITIKMTKDAGNSSSALINALVFQSYTSSIVVSPMPPSPSSPPGPPTLLVAHGVSTTAISLNWVANANASKYYIYKSTSLTGTFTLLDSVMGNISSYTHNGLTPGTGFFYELKSKNTAGLSIAGNIAYGTSLQLVLDIQFDSDQPSGALWNSFNGYPSQGLSISNLVSTSGSGTGISVTITHNFDGANTLGAVTGNNSGLFPDKVIRGQFYTQTPDSAVVTLSGLSLSSSYDLAFFNSWANPFATSITSFTVNGVTVILDAANNTSSIAQINNIQPNSSGLIILVIKAAPGSMFGIISAMVLQAHPIPPNSPNTTILSVNKEKISFFDPTNKYNTPEVKVFPVPFNSYLNIQFTSAESGEYKVHIFDTYGRLVLEEPYLKLESGENVFTLNGNLSTLSSGIYILRIESNKFNPIIKKIIK